MAFRIRKRIGTYLDFLNSITDLGESLVKRNAGSIEQACNYFISSIKDFSESIRKENDALFEKAIEYAAKKTSYTINIDIESRKELRLLLNTFDSDELEEKKGDRGFIDAVGHFYGSDVQRKVMVSESIEEALSILSDAEKKGRMRAFYPFETVEDRLTALSKFEGRCYYSSNLVPGERFSRS
jgi:ribosome-binding ATPase YchF (GTP1/OBG family)